jgi:acetoin utilization deacetylase AcuC-like enzyme
MKVVHSPLHALHDGGVELYRGNLVPLFEMPARAEMIRAALEAAGHEVVAPRELPESRLLGIHDREFVEFLRGVHARWIAEGREGHVLPSGFPARGLRRDRRPTGISGQLGWYAFDASTPIVAGTWDAALAAARCAMTAAALVAEGEQASFGLCRPPGHHAGRSTYGGYCYLNNAALAAQYLLDAGRRRVSLIDVDYHHGNGTQEIFWERDDVQFVSLHGAPDTEYPWYLGYADERGAGPGDGFTLNLPLPAGTGWDGYRSALGLPRGVAGRRYVRVGPDQRVQARGTPLSPHGRPARGARPADRARAGRRIRRRGDRRKRRRRSRGVRGPRALD